MTFILLFILALPLIEIAGFVVVGSEIGVLATIALVILSGVAGSILLRIQGFGVLTRIRAELEAGRDPGRELAHGAMILLAGILLLIPGFVTDIVGLLLFVPPVRDLVWRFLKRRVVVSGSFSAGFGGFRRPQARRQDDRPRRRGLSAARPIPNRPGGSAPTTRLTSRPTDACDFAGRRQACVACRRHASQRPISIRAAMRPQQRNG